MPLPRAQLFELEDLRWFPGSIRDFTTDYLGFLSARFGLHRPSIPLLRKALNHSNATRVIDLCSGGGGPVLALDEAQDAQTNKGTEVGIAIG